jgi:hypothetical protein
MDRAMEEVPSRVNVMSTDVIRVLDLASNNTEVPPFAEMEVQVWTIREELRVDLALYHQRPYPTQEVVWLAMVKEMVLARAAWMMLARLSTDTRAAWRSFLMDALSLQRALIERSPARTTRSNRLHQPFTRWETIQIIARRALERRNDALREYEAFQQHLLSAETAQADATRSLEMNAVWRASLAMEQQLPDA